VLALPTAIFWTAAAFSSTDACWRSLCAPRETKMSGSAIRFRAWFGGSTKPDSRNEVIQFAAQLGCLTEWSSTNLLAVDADTEVQAQAIADYLSEREEDGSLVFETGRTTCSKRGTRLESGDIG